MKTLNEKELLEMKGGFSFWAGCAIVGIVCFVVGVIDGLVRPNSCKSG